jgi:2-amino-4-hydroxy-6-hydroxymethyldihydropteridine diphosphokinase
MKSPATDGCLVHIGLGSNLGDRIAELQAGVTAMASHPRIEIRALSGVFESAYVGPGEAQPDYLNACAAVVTDLEPAALLAVLKGIEQDRGRASRTHMRPRTLDLDILLYGDLRMSEPDLEIPHPRLEERAFVLDPLAELDPDLVLPDSGQTVAQRCAMIHSTEGRITNRRSDFVLSAMAVEEM